MVITSKKEKDNHTTDCYSAMKISEPELSVPLWLYLTHNSERKQHVTEKYGNMQNNAIGIYCLAVNAYVVETHGTGKRRFNIGVSSWGGGRAKEEDRGEVQARSKLSVIFYSLSWVVGGWMFGHIFLSIFSFIQNVCKVFLNWSDHCQLCCPSLAMPS